ncbi:MAG: polysaccharide biosynthesis protein [Acidimicrobiia bacterium]
MAKRSIERRRTARQAPGLAVARAASRIPADLSLALLDCFVVFTVYTVLLVLRFDLEVPPEYWDRFLVFLPVAMVVHLVANRVWRTYGHMWEHASIEEARRLLLAGLSVEIALLGIFVWPTRYRLPLSVLLVGPVLSVMVMGATRFQSRLFAFRRSRERGPGLRIAVVGAGAGGAAAVREMRRNQQLGLIPVAVIDDDIKIRGRSLSGVPIIGGIDELERVVLDLEVHQVLLAISRAEPTVAERVAAGASAAGVPVKVVPRIAELVRGRASLRDVRDLRIDDLLGREQVEIHFEMVRALLAGRRVLVTGGGGSIGAEIARQVASFEPAELVVLDHDETHLHDAAQGLPATTRQVLADIRDRGGLHKIFDDLRPDIVFHAAAYKHVPILEAHACEAADTNVLGTVNVVDAAVRSGAERLVSISTDKAAGPSSVMGASKWLAEQVVLLRTPPGRRFCAVRFGNVLGSRGSVIPTFQRQIAAGGPVTVTDARMTRYFMSTREAVSLVLQAAASEDRGVLMLEMGKPVNILALAEDMIRLCGHEVHEIGIEFTGPRPGEVLVEEMSGPGEDIERTAHPAIVSVRPVELTEDELQEALRDLADAVARGDHDRARSGLRAVTSIAARPEFGAPRPDELFLPIDERAGSAAFPLE